MKTPRKCHNHEAQSSRGIKTRREAIFRAFNLRQTAHMFIIKTCIRIKGAICVNKADLSCFSTDLSKAIPLLQFSFVCASLVSFAAFVLSLFVSHYLSCFWCLGSSFLCDCSISWVYLFFALDTY